MANKATPKRDPRPVAAPSPAPATAALSNSRYGAGPVWSAFRDAAGELEILDDDVARYVDDESLEYDGQDCCAAA